MQVILFTLSLGVTAICAISLFKGEPKAIQAETLGNVEVSSLIARLRPLALDPSSRYSGLEVSFSGSDVTIRLKMKNGNEFNGKASTLKEAVARITSPSSEIKEALRGWGDQ